MAGRGKDSQVPRTRRTPKKDWKPDFLAALADTPWLRRAALRDRPRSRPRAVVGHTRGERRNVVAHCDVREVRRLLPGVSVQECSQVAMRSALMRALELASGTEALV